MAPKQWGKFHSLSNSFAIDFHSWLLEGSCRKHYLLKYTINIWLQDLQNKEICDNLQNTTTGDYEFVQPIRTKRNLKKSF